MSEWQPIETAPKDETTIIVCDKEGHVGGAFWQNSWYGDRNKSGWMIANCDEEYGCYVKATHWMPFPEPPKDES